ncbi:MAG: Ig-like domain-containing protein, partial [bacterium]|nr:Ig-like domain-containing protein [bacterium]
PTAFALSSGNGTKTVYLWVMDRAGNINGCKMSIVLDTTSPQVILNSPLSNGFGKATFTLGYYLSEDVASISVTFIRTGEAAHGTESLQTTRGDNNVLLDGSSLGLVNGTSYMITIKAMDFAGNISQPASAYNWTYDTSPPGLQLVYPAENGADNSSIRVEYILSEDVHPGYLRLMFGTTTISNGLGSKAGKQSIELTNLGLVDGAIYTVRLEAMDMAGNLSSVANSNWRYDTTIATPSLSLSGTFTTSQLVMIDIGTDTDVIGWLLSENQATPPESSDLRWLSAKPSVFSLSSGTGIKNIYLWVKDMSGNMSHCMRSIAIDTEIPIIIFSQPASGGFGTQNIRVKYSLSEDIASGTLRLSFIQTGGSHDGYSPHQYILSDTLKGDHSFVGTYSLVDGAVYTVTLEGEDTAGNKAQLATNVNWTYDISAPTINMLKPSNNGCDNHDIELVYVLSETVKPDSMLLMFSGTPASAALPYNKGTNTANIDISGLNLTHGQTYTVTMQAKDMAGNPSGVVTKTNWTYDNYIDIPTLELATTTTSRLVYGTITNDNEAVVWLLGEGKNAQSSDWRSTRPSAVYLSSAEAGVKLVDLYVRDAAGNINHTSATITLTTSTSAQLGVSIQSPLSGEAASQTIHLQYTLTEPVDPESLRLVFIHSSGANDPNSPHTVTNRLVPSAGVHNVLIKGYDLNMDGNQTTTDCLVDGAVYTLRLEAATKTSQINNLRYDISPPVISLISPAINGYGKETIPVRYQASEPLAQNSLQLIFSRGTEVHTVTTLLLSQQGSMYVNGNDLNNDGTVTTSDILINGATYTICFQASDLAGNRAAPVYAANWMYDTSIGTPIIVLSGGATYTNSSIVAVKTTEDSDIAKWLISETQKVAPAIDNPLWTNMPTAYSFSVGEGQKTVYLWVQDGAGNINQSPASDTIIMDTIAPQIILKSPAANGAGNGTITASYYLSEDAAAGTITFKPSGSGTDTTHVVTGLLLYRGENTMEISTELKDGVLYTVSLAAEDFAGNIGIAAVNHNWRYDTTIGKPTLLLRDHLTNGTQWTGARLIRVEIGGDKEDVIWLINEDADAANNNDLPWQQNKPAYFTLGTTSGIHTVFLWMRDRAGNISDAASCSISLDMELPTLQGTPTANGQFFPSGTYTITWDASLAASGIVQYEVQEYSGSITPVAEDWQNKANAYFVPGTTSILGFKNKKHGDSFWYRLRARNNVGEWSPYSCISERVIIAQLFGTNTEVLGSSTDGRALVNIPKDVLTLDTYLIIGRDPLNHPRLTNPESIQCANAKDDVDLSWDRVDNTITEFTAYACDNGIDTRISTFTQKVRITLKYQDVNQDGFVDNVPYKLDELTLKIFWLNESTKQWEQVETSSVDSSNNMVSAEVEHFSTFILRGIPLRPAAVLGNVRVYPNPYKPNSNPNHNSGIHFGGTAAPFEERLTENVTIKIFTVSGELVRVIDGQTSGEYVWDIKNDDGDEISTGVYIYQITNEQGGNSFGKIAIVR